MGQYQLLLIALMFSVAAVAVVVGVNAYQEQRAQSRQEALIQAAHPLGVKAQSWFNRPDLKPNDDDREGAGSQPGNVQSGEPTWGQLDVGEHERNDEDRYETPWGTVERVALGGGRVQLKLRMAGEDEPFGETTFTPGRYPAVQFDEDVNGAPPPASP